MINLKNNWSDKAKTLVYLVIAIELAIVGYIAYDHYDDFTKDKKIHSTAISMPNKTKTTTDDCIIQFIKGKTFRICP